MIKTVLKFVVIVAGTWFAMILLASLIPALQNTVFALATYIVPWIIAFKFTDKKKAPAKKQQVIEPEIRTHSASYAQNPKPSQAPDVKPRPVSAPAQKSYAPDPPAQEKKPSVSAPRVPAEKPSTPRPPVPEEAPHVSAPAAEEEKPTIKTRTYKVAGVTSYTDNILSLACENPNYALSKKALIDEGYIDEKVWKYEFYPSRLELLPEPDHPKDPEAIKVLIDDQHVGYIKHGSCAHVKKLIKTGNVVRADCKIGGGPYKYVYEEYDYDRDKDVYEMDRSSTNLFVHLEITERV